VASIDTTASEAGTSSAVLLGDPDDHVSLTFRRTVDAPEGGWVPPVEATATVSARSFTGASVVAVREEELLGFRRQVTRLCEAHEHEAMLKSVDERLCVRLRSYAHDDVVVQGHLADDREGNTLVFAVRGLGHARLLSMLHELREVELELGIRTASTSHVEVRSRFDGCWVPGFEVVDVREVEAERLFRVRRCSDGLVLPTQFGAEEIRVPAS
jgi:hypothetical protein